MNHIKYKSGYKYQLDELFEIDTGFIGKPHRSSFLSFYGFGKLVIHEGYAWDGSSWSLDNKKSMPASVVHDALYQLMRMGYIDPEIYRDKADLLYQRMCVDAKMCKWWAWLRYKALVWFGGAASDPDNRRPIIIVSWGDHD